MGLKLQLVSIFVALCLMQSTMAKSLAFASEGEVPTGFPQYHPDRSGNIENSDIEPYLPDIANDISFKNVKYLDDSINTGVGGLSTVDSGKTHTPDIDEQLLVPPGCLQCYPERTGTTNLRYAICFKRTSSVCGVKLMARNLQLSSLSDKNNQVDLDCDGSACDNRRGDYLPTPNGVSDLGHRERRAPVVPSAPPGPLYTFFNSDKYIT